MAIYYWVGGSGTWNNSSTTNWAVTSGGPGGNGPPNNTDTVNFDSNSGTAATVTVASTAVSLNTTINKSDITLSLSGNATLATGTLTLSAGTLTTNNNNLTVGVMVFSTTGTRVLNMGSSTFTVLGTSGNSNSWDVQNSTNLVINSGTSTIILAESFTGISQQNFVGGGFAYYNLGYSGNQTSAITGNNSFNNIQIPSTVNPMVLEFEAGSTQTVTDFAVGGIATNLLELKSTIPGTAYTLAKSGPGTIEVLYCNISDSTVTPADTWYAPATIGVSPDIYNIDAGGNTNWIFDPGPQAYRISQAGILYSSTAEFDEITQSSISMSKTAMTANEFDEVTGIPTAMRYTNAGTVLVQEEFDEITLIIPE